MTRKNGLSGSASDSVPEISKHQGRGMLRPFTGYRYRAKLFAPALRLEIPVVIFGIDRFANHVRRARAGKEVVVLVGIR